MNNPISSGETSFRPFTWLSFVLALCLLFSVSISGPKLNGKYSFRGLFNRRDGSSRSSIPRTSGERRRSYGLPLPSCQKKDIRARSFLLVFSGHSGSTAITSELDTHPKVHMEQKEMVEKRGLVNNETAALAATRDFFKRGLLSGKSPGFKIRPIHVNRAPNEWIKLVREFDTRIIWQHRKNILKQAVGQYSNHYFNDNSSRMGILKKDIGKRCSTGAGCSFKIEDLDYFHSLLKVMWKNDASVLSAAVRMDDGRGCLHELSYEDYLYNRKGAMGDLQDFLGLRFAETTPFYHKATGDNLCDVVSNWDEICASFYGCLAWRPYFEDERNRCSCEIVASPEKFCSFV